MWVGVTHAYLSLIPMSTMGEHTVGADELRLGQPAMKCLPTLSPRAIQRGGVISLTSRVLAYGVGDIALESVVEHHEGCQATVYIVKSLKTARRGPSLSFAMGKYMESL